MTDGPSSKHPREREQSGLAAGDERVRRIAAGQLGEQLGAIVARVEAMTDDLAALDRGEDEGALSSEGRHIFERAGAEGIRERLKALEAERAEVAAHADRLCAE